MSASVLKRLQKPGKDRIVVALVLFLLLVGTIGLAIVGLFGGGPDEETYETGSASIDDFLNIRSEMSIPDGDLVFVASDSDPLYAMIATPLAVRYEANMSISPLLVYQGLEDRYTYTDASSSVNKFLSDYGTSNTTAIVIGDALYSNLDVALEMAPFCGGNMHDAEAISLEVARTFWTQSAAVILVEQSEWGYQEAVNTVPLAAYLGIPVIVADKMDEKIAPTLQNLGVKYSIVCGGIGGYGRTLRHVDTDANLLKHVNANLNQNESAYDSKWLKANPREIRVLRARADYHQHQIADDVIKVIKERIGGDINYVVMANPADVKAKKVAMITDESGNQVPDQIVYYEEGIIMDSAGKPYPGAAPYGNDGPSFVFDIPYDYANVIVDVKMDVSEARGPSSAWRPGSPIEGNADGSGERVYIFLGMDKNGDGVLDTESDESQFFGGSPGYNYIRSNPDLGYSPTNPPIWAHLSIELPFFMDPVREHVIQLLGKLPTDPDVSAPYEVTITVQNLTDPTFPLMPGLSSMAPYLAA
ncbi:MAG: hypothetical protein KAT70_07910, partial [Thermoplasmata archaeon]|nr:hypothetical protein [Thermoplasmata archaeon]